MKKKTDFLEILTNEKVTRLLKKRKERNNEK